MKSKHANLDTFDGAIPISGQPFRTAVCWLAVDVMLGGG